MINENSSPRSSPKIDKSFKSIFQYDEVKFQAETKNDHLLQRKRLDIWKKSLELTRNKLNQVEISHKEEDPCKASSIVEEFIVWSLLTKFDCYSKIFEYKRIYSKLIWIVFYWLL